MRKVLLLFFILLIFTTAWFFSNFYIRGPELKANAAILMDADSKKVLYSRGEKSPFAPASMSKMMTEYIVLEKIVGGEIGWNDSVRISPASSHSEGVKIEVKEGETLSVKDLFYAMAMASANNAAVALAEKIAGNEKNFTKLMNQKASKLGLSKDTHFVNCTGLTNLQNEESRMTAHDVALLAQHLLKEFPEILEITKQEYYQLKYKGIKIRNTNKMVHASENDLGFEGMDGLKTGFTDQAGYCFTGTAKQGKKRLISVVMGTKEENVRFIETKKLLSFGFKQLYIPSLEEIMNETALIVEQF